MTRKKTARGKGTTRQAILAAARKRFSAASYDDVGLRDLAADVGVDVAYVHRSFGSKEQLFREVLEEQRPEKEIAVLDAGCLAGEIARATYERSQAKRCEEADPLMILIRSLGSPAAGRMVGERLTEDVIEPLRRKIGEATPMRTSLVLSMLIGFSILDTLLELPAVTEADPQAAETLMADAIDAILRLQDTSRQTPNG